MKFDDIKTGMFLRYEHRLVRVLSKDYRSIFVDDERDEFTMYKHRTNWNNWEPDVAEFNKDKIKKELGV